MSPCRTRGGAGSAARPLLSVRRVLTRRRLGSTTENGSLPARLLSYPALLHDCRMLSLDDFWSLIDTLNGRIDAESPSELSAQLAQRGTDDIKAFSDVLAELVYAIDSRDRAEQLIVDPSEGDEPMSMGDDLFLYARCAVVIEGRDAYQRVLEDPPAMAGRWYAFEAEHLIYISAWAWEKATGTEWDWEYQTPVSWETGSNAGQWS